MKKEFTLIVLEVCFVFSIFSQNPPQDKNWDTVFIDNFNALIQIVGVNRMRLFMEKMKILNRKYI